jgi:hypothetical protein
MDKHMHKNNIREIDSAEPLVLDNAPIHPATTKVGEGESGANSSWAMQGVVSEMRKLRAKLDLQRHPLAGLPETLVPLLGAKGNRGWKRSLDETILDMAPGDALKVAGVLAHDTAFKELNAMLRTAEVLAEYFALDFKLVVTHWEQLVHPVSDEVFKTVVNGVESQLKRRFPRSELIAIDRRATTASAPFVQAREEIWDRIEGTPCVEDLNWIISFYGRQNSYRPSGMAQALHDFTMRRGLGLLIESIDPGLALLTERTDRLSRCYRCPCPVLNVKPSIL